MTLKSQRKIWNYPSEDPSFTFFKKEVSYEERKEFDTIKYGHALIYLEMKINWKFCLNNSVWNAKQEYTLANVYVTYLSNFVDFSWNSERLICMVIFSF